MKRTHRLVLCALFAALTCVATLTLQMPSPTGGYCNLGDCVILLGAFFLPPLGALAAGGIGAMLADLLLGFAVYAPATLGIKALLALTAALLFRALREKTVFFALLTACLCGEAVMVAGYFLFESGLYGAAAAAQSLLMTNLPQAALAVVSAMALYGLFYRTQKGRTLHV
ncbi:MAG: ECF transporter S component [Oscillospiraceae bacterium]|jgi:uncharacterized membrane protein|nr:ECF transporter S component [Oscillospiraceae bacterium]